MAATRLEICVCIIITSCSRCSSTGSPMNEAQTRSARKRQARQAEAHMRTSTFTCQPQDFSTLACTLTAANSRYHQCISHHPHKTVNMAVLDTKALPIRLSGRSAKQILNDLTTLYVRHRTRISRTVYLAFFLALIQRIRNAIQKQKDAAARAAEERRSGLSTGKGDGSGKKKVELNREFFRSLFKLLRICMPTWRCREIGLLSSYSMFLVLRTLISLYVAELDGRLVGSLVKGRGKAFLKGLVWWMIVAVPATFTNSMV